MDFSKPHRDNIPQKNGYSPFFCLICHQSANQKFAAKKNVIFVLLFSTPRPPEAEEHSELEYFLERFSPIAPLQDWKVLF